MYRTQIKDILTLVVMTGAVMLCSCKTSHVATSRDTQQADTLTHKTTLYFTDVKHDTIRTADTIRTVIKEVIVMKENGDTSRVYHYENNDRSKAKIQTKTDTLVKEKTDTVYVNKRYVTDVTNVTGGSKDGGAAMSWKKTLYSIAVAIMFILAILLYDKYWKTKDKK